MFYNNEEEKFEKQSNARAQLVISANFSARTNKDPQEWIQSEHVRHIINHYELDENIAFHIAAFVWTFKR